MDLNQAGSNMSINGRGGLNIADDLEDDDDILPKINLNFNMQQPSTSTSCAPKPSTSSQEDNSLKRKQALQDEVVIKKPREVTMESDEDDSEIDTSKYYRIVLTSLKAEKYKKMMHEHKVTFGEESGMETKTHYIKVKINNAAEHKKILNVLHQRGMNLSGTNHREDLQIILPDRKYEDFYSKYCLTNGNAAPSHIPFMGIKERSTQNEPLGVIEANSNNMNLNIDDTYEYLSGIFPNADPHYLRSAAENLKNENDVKTFVDNKLESNDYPTREQNSAKTKVTEEQQRYTTNFNVEQFLTVFPDPFSYFEDETRKCQYSLIVADFLKNEFGLVRANTVTRIYKSSKFNMSIAAKNLRLTADFISKARCRREVPTENMPLLQEMAFVRHHESIRKHMEVVKQKEEEEFNSLKAAGGLWTCECCYDDECVPTKCSTCDNAHVFCNSCVVKGTDTKLGDGETRVPCFLNCGSEFSISTLQKVLPLKQFNILLKKRQAAEVMVAGLEGLVSCPFCHFASIPPEGDKVFKCLNPECMKESCILCKEPNHVPFKCEEQQKKDKARKYIEEKMTQALTRTCYKCKKVFFKEEGCNKMTCPCGAIMCYICNNPVKDYQHFAGQGSNERDKCPLWTDNQRLNAQAVRKVEEDARMKLLRQDPNLDIGTTILAPVLPPPMPGPHHGMPDTHNIANMLAARVLNAGHIDLQ